VDLSDTAKAQHPDADRRHLAAWALSPRSLRESGMKVLFVAITSPVHVRLCVQS
jgi:hypothetical protein